MKTILLNILAVVVGLVVGSAVNMGLIMSGHHLVPLPQGADVSTMEGLKNSMHLFETKHFLFPFLAHALGTLVGAVVAALIAASHKQKFAYVIGAAFLCGGAINVYLLPAPMWFNAVDLIFAYIPMAWLGGKIAGVITKPK